MHREYEALVNAYEAGGRVLFYPDGSRCRGNAWATNFWMGFDGQGGDKWDRASRATLAYAHWRAGQDCANKAKGK